MFYPDDLIDRVREANDIVDVIGSYVPLKKRGANLIGLCPFHSEKTGSFSVSPSKQIYKCFGCGQGGNVFNFISTYDNITFQEAVKVLADRAGIALPEADISEEQRQRNSLKEKILEVNREAAKYYFVMLRDAQGAHAYKYLTDRGLSDDTIRNFGLGYAGKYSDGLYKYLKSKGFNDDILSETGLFSFNMKGGSDKFWNRVMFPIMDRQGKVIAFGGRIMGQAENAPKYLNSPETKAFIKGDNIYGLHIARRTKRDYFLLCEGYMDVITLHQAGFDNAVASLGTALTPRQAKLISRYVDKVVITYDSDEAGQKASLRAIPILQDAGIRVNVIDLRPEKDPDEFIKAYGAEAYAQRVEEARGAFFYEAETIRDKIDTQNPAEKTKFDHELARKLASITDELERNNYIAASAAKYNVDVGALTRLVNKIGLEELKKKEDESDEEDKRFDQRRKKSEPTGTARSEFMLISFVVSHPSYADVIRKFVSAQDFSDETCGKVLNEVYNLTADGRIITHASIIDKFEADDDREKVAQILMGSDDEENISDSQRDIAFSEIVARVLDDALRRQSGSNGVPGQNLSFAQVAARRNEIMRIKSMIAGLSQK